MPVVSIVMPVRDAADTLAEALASIDAQTVPDWELLAINDGSCDGSGDMLEAAARADARIGVYHLSPSGIAAALNVGIRHCRSPLIARFDADDVMRPARLEKQIALLAARPEIGICGCLVEYGGDRTANAGYARYVDWINGLCSPEAIALNRFVESPLAHPSAVIRAEVFSQCGPYADGAFPEDYEFWLRALDAGIGIAKVPEVLLRWNDPPNRLSRVDRRYATEAFYRCKARYLVRWLAAYVPEDRPRAIWGAGRLTRKRAAILRSAGIEIAAWIDIDPAKIGRTVDGLPVISPDQLPAPGELFVISCVGKRDARELISENLAQRGWVAGRDFILAA